VRQSAEPYSDMRTSMISLCQEGKTLGLPRVEE
jgi:hypothetical protein